MEKLDPRIAPSPEAASDDFASPSHNPLDFEPVPLRYRSDGLTPDKQREFVEALADTGVAREAAARIGVSEQAVNRVRRRADARAFDRACEAAHIFGARRLRSTAFERGIEGTLKGHYYHGELVSQERVYDNRLLIYLLGKTEHLIALPKGSRAICDHWEDHMDALERGLPAPGLAPHAMGPEPAGALGDELTEDEDGIWWTHFPPPADFDGEEQGRWGDVDYQRTLSPREQAVVDADLAEELEEERLEQAARRDRFFGFEGDEISHPMEDETSETSEPVEEEDAPIEYKSLVRPSPARARRGPPAAVPAPRPGRIWGRSHIQTPSSRHPYR